MRTLVIYDNDGMVINQLTGDVIEPNIATKLWVEVPYSKTIDKIDIGQIPPVAKFKDKQKSTVEILENKVEQQEDALANLAFMMMELGGN